MDVAIVTGASRGLGRGLARALAREGYLVVAVARDREALDGVVDGIVASGGRAHPIVADVADEDAAARIAGRSEAFGPVSLLVNNASALGPTPLRPLLDLHARDVAAVFATNVFGPLRLATAVGGAMAMRGRGTLLFVSSDAAVEAYPGWGAYGASKAAADHLARTFAAELAPRGVRALSVDPGEMDTAMHAAALPEADRATLADPDVIAEVIAGRLRDPSVTGRFLVRS
jgi:NAD(P)-dependent dehydrogenase (short-subunit alcohol dehydrogenase family)